jgi:hypothetical protein
LFVKTFRHDFFVKRFCGVFELPPLRNTRKRDKTKKNRGNTDIKVFVVFFGKSFRHGPFVNILYGYRETPKNIPKKSQGGGKSAGRWVGLRFSKCTGGLSICFASPSLGYVASEPVVA